MQVLSGARSKTLSVSRPLAGILFFSALAGCSLVEDRSERYVSAPEGEMIEVPEGADASRIGQAMPIRNISTSDTRRYYPSELPAPPDMTSEILDENYVIEELDGRAWLLVNEVPGQLWPAVSAWMNETRLGVAEQSPQAGVLQSELANFSKRSRDLLGLPGAPSADEDRVVVQARLTPGVRRKTTEIRVRKLTLDDSPEGLLPWNEQTSVSDRALAQQKELLSGLSTFLQGRENSKSVSRAASDMISRPQVSLMKHNDVPLAMRIELGYDRAWAELSRSLEASDVAVVDMNREEGWFRVDFRTADERGGGWLSSLGSSPELVHTHTVDVKGGADAVLVTVDRSDDYTGDHSSGDLLTLLFDDLN